MTIEKEDLQKIINNEIYLMDGNTGSLLIFDHFEYGENNYNYNKMWFLCLDDFQYVCISRKKLLAENQYMLIKYDARMLNETIRRSEVGLLKRVVCGEKVPKYLRNDAIQFVQYLERVCNSNNEKVAELIYKRRSVQELLTNVINKAS